MDPGPAEDVSKTPQDLLDEYWENLITKKPSKVTNIFPQSLYTNLLPPQRKPGPVKGRNAAESFQAAADECRARVKRIVKECRRTNEKFTDPEFDIEDDLGDSNCLKGLMNWYNKPPPPPPSVGPGRLGDALSTIAEANILNPAALQIDLAAAVKAIDFGQWSGDSRPGSVHRIDWIYDNPQFTVDGFSSTDVKQGASGDCWFVAAIATLCSNPPLMEKICVERDEECGVYGFVFQRDGDWIWTVVDDNLYLKYSDFDAYGDDYDPTGVKEAKYKQNKQTGSDALHFAACADQNETWLPLLEKAYAKVHGDYEAIAGGWSGEAVEDLTGGVTTKILTNRILSKQRLWEELLEVNKTFLFSASSPGSWGGDSDARQGLALSHAYSVIKAVEEEDEDGKKHRLVLIRNPWGERANASMGEWNGSWSDGSKEWTPYWMKKLNHRFGNDGIFWMSYDDLRKRFDILDRTRLFDEKWTVVQHWTSSSVAWVTGYLNTKFVVEIKKGGPTVFCLCQLDERYFRGLEGKYNFDLHFVLQQAESKAGDHIVRARGAWFGNRSISAEVDLEPGTYEIVPKIVASRDADANEVYDVVTKTAETNPQKLRQIGMNYDIANAKGVVELTDEEKKEKEEKKKAATDKKQKEKEEAEKDKADFEAWKKEKKEREEKEAKEKAEKEEKEKNGNVDGAEKKEGEKSEKAKGDTGKQEIEADKPADATQPDTTAMEKAEAQKDPAAPPTTEGKSEGSKSEATLKAETPSTTEKDTSARAPATTSDAGAAPLPVHQKLQAPEAPGATLSAPPSPSLLPLYDSPADSAKPGGTSGASDMKQNPWNAVCVLGLRVYSLDPEVTIKLVKPKNEEEAAVLDADGKGSVVGATM